MGIEAIAAKIGQQYRDISASLVIDGYRPPKLLCEAKRGEICSETLFADIDQGSGIVKAATKMINSCPKGKLHAIRAIIWSTGVGIGLLSATSGIKSPCDCVPPFTGDPSINFSGDHTPEGVNQC